MKLDTLFRRIETRVDCPPLGAVLRGEADVSDLPTGCLPWSKLDPNRPPRLVQSGGQMYATVRPKAPEFVVQGRKVIVIRWIWQHLHSLEGQFRLINQCGNALCINPLHWEAQATKQEEHEAVPEPIYSAEWTEEDVQDMVELCFTRHQITSIEELEGAPREMIQTYLTVIGKGHLLE